MKFTVVLGIDMRTLEYLRVVWPTWIKHKPSLLLQDWLIFYNNVTPDQIDRVLQLPRSKLVAWPSPGVEYNRDGLTKWDRPQRAKMLAGFVHVPACHVETPYWLKIDVDSIATGNDDWVQPGWFDDNPSIVAPGWNYTKPPDQMEKLDAWASRHEIPMFNGTAPLDLHPEPGSELVRHKRIASWCAFFSTEFTALCSITADATCGRGQLPVDSQDGFLWYCAKRAGFTMNVVNMRKHGWRVRHSFQSVKGSADEVLA